MGKGIGLKLSSAIIGLSALVIVFEPLSIARSHTSSSTRHHASTSSSTKSKSSSRTAVTSRRGSKSKSKTKTSKAKGKHPKAAAVVSDQPDSLPQEKGNYEILDKAYALYDRGLNERLAGNDGDAIADLSEAQHLIHPLGTATELEVYVLYDLGQAAEDKGDYKLAKESYGKAVYVKSNFVQATRALTRVLALSGHQTEALVKAREASQLNPSDPMAHMMLGIVLDKNGFPADGGTEKQKAIDLSQSNQ